MSYPEITDEVMLHCVKSYIGDEMCEECPIYRQVGSDHCEMDVMRKVVKILERHVNNN